MSVSISELVGSKMSLSPIDTSKTTELLLSRINSRWPVWFINPCILEEMPYDESQTLAAASAGLLKSDSGDVKANKRKFPLDALDHHMQHLNVAEKAALKGDAERLANLSATGKENKCLFLVG